MNSPLDFTNNRTYFKTIPKRDILMRDTPTYDAFADDIAGLNKENNNSFINLI